MKWFDIFWHKWLRRPYTLAVEDVGQGKTVVLLHGLGGNGNGWRALMGLLEDKGYRVIVPDLLGFGNSPRPEWTTYNVTDHARAVVATLKRQKVTHPVILVGHSMGSLVATHIAATHPTLVKRLILYVPPLFTDDPAFRKHTRRRERYFAFFEYIATHPHMVLLHQRWIWKAMKRLAGLDLDHEKWLPFERSLRNTIMEQRAYHELLAVTMKTDIIYGRLDFVVIRTEIEKMFAANRHIHIHIVTGMHGISTRAAKYIAALIAR